MRSFVTAIVVLILGIACLGIAAFRGMATRFPIAGIVPLAWSAIDLFFAFTQSSIDSQAEKVTDERDRYIAEKRQESPADHQLRNWCRLLHRYVSVCRFQVGTTAYGDDYTMRRSVPHAFRCNWAQFIL